MTNVTVPIRSETWFVPREVVEHGALSQAELVAEMIRKFEDRHGSIIFGSLSVTVGHAQADPLGVMTENDYTITVRGASL